MADSDGEFYVDSEGEEVREVIKIDEANPIYNKAISDEPDKINLKMVQVEKKEEPTLYEYFRIKKRAVSEKSQDNESEISFHCPFTDFYDKQQLVYQRYNNQHFNKINGSSYFAGAFIEKNIFFDSLKEDSQSLHDIVEDYFEDKKTIETFWSADDPLFDSNFESGNLFAAFRVGKNEYDLVMQNDTNCKGGNNQWFFFSLEKLASGIDYTFNVVNFTKNDSLFNYGMAPAVYSTILNKKSGTGWFRTGKDVTYKKGAIQRENSHKYYYQLSFKINWKHNNDKLFIAHSYPYTFTKLNKFMDKVLEKNKDICWKVCFGQTFSKKNMESLMISHQGSRKKDQRKAIIIMSRQHPGETQGSFVCEGVIEKLLQKCKQSEYLRKNYVIYIIPMVNPDGVIFGHYRTNLIGRDLNRKWDIKEKQQTCPEVTSIKKFLQQISKDREIRFILDLHGHSKKMNSFFYGNPCPENPEYVRTFPFVCSKLNSAIEFHECTFASEQSKRKAARVYLSYLYKQLHVYTFQSSFYGYFSDGKKHEFTPKEYGQLGHTLVHVLALQLESGLVENKTSIREISNLTSSTNNVFVKSLIQLKGNKNLLEMGNDCDSGSESKPDEGQIEVSEIPKAQKIDKRVPTPILEENPSSVVKNSSRKSYSRRVFRQPKEHKEVIKPVRNFKFLQISRVNSVLPDKYQLGLQPIRKKEPVEMPFSKSSSSIMKISNQCQTEDLPLNDVDLYQIQTSRNLSNSVKMESRSLNERRYSSVIKNSNHNNHHIIFKIDFVNPTTYSVREKKYSHAFSQTMISFCRQSNFQASSQLLPVVESPEHQRSRRNGIKYDTVKVGMKREAEIFLNGMVKKYLVQKEMRLAEREMKERPLSIKRKEIYKK